MTRKKCTWTLASKDLVRRAAPKAKATPQSLLPTAAAWPAARGVANGHTHTHTHIHAHAWYMRGECMGVDMLAVRDQLPEASPRIARPEGSEASLLDDRVGGGPVALVLSPLDVALHTSLDSVGRVREHAANRCAEEGGGEASAVLGLAWAAKVPRKVPRRAVKGAANVPRGGWKPPKGGGEGAAAERSAGGAEGSAS